MTPSRAKGIFIAVAAWVVIALILALSYRFFVSPRQKADLVADTSGDSNYDHDIRVAADSFSGYAILRSDTLAADLRTDAIRLSVIDDGADYRARIKALRDGNLDMAVFTIDSLIAAGAALGEHPATIVLVIDETKGADAIVTYENAIKQVDDLDHPDARLVLTPDSPSEFLARVMIADFGLRNLPDNWIIPANGAADAYQQFRQADRNARRAYVLWEPYVSRARQQSGAKILLDSAAMSGYIVDVLVAQRSFLRNHPDLVARVVRGYLSALYAHRDAGALAELITEDARKTGGERLSADAARTLVDGIRWKNTLENYAHFGLLPADQTRGLQLIEDMIVRITRVLQKTGAVADNPLPGGPTQLFYDDILRSLQSDDFHPGRALQVINDTGATLDEIRADTELPALSEQQWDRLVAVGEMQTAPISFARGTARLNIQSERELTALAERLRQWPQYYLTIVGHTRGNGDPEANRQLANNRAQAAADFLRQAGLHANRLRCQAVPLPGRGGEAQSVSFVVGQMPY
jgi:ABC-type nitrate/sulfonate/bicarbonate transport system substrate-binding protein